MKRLWGYDDDKWQFILVSLPILKRFSAENFQSPAKKGPKNGVFRENGGPNVKFYFQNPKRHILARNGVF